VAIVAVMRKLLLLAWIFLRTRQAFAAPERPRPLGRVNDANQTCARGSCPATTQPAGT
jgi:hypothetical protein